MHPVFFLFVSHGKMGHAVLFCIWLAFACLLNALQSLAQAVVSTYVLCAVAYVRVYGGIVFCPVFSTRFNIMSALLVHQLPTLPQIIDSRGGLFRCKKGVASECWQNEFLFEKAAICTSFGAICC